MVHRVQYITCLKKLMEEGSSKAFTACGGKGAMESRENCDSGLYLHHTTPSETTSLRKQTRLALIAAFKTRASKC